VLDLTTVAARGLLAWLQQRAPHTLELGAAGAGD
jgi:hypothetical protein